MRIQEQSDGLVSQITAPESCRDIHISSCRLKGLGGTSFLKKDCFIRSLFFRRYGWIVTISIQLFLQNVPFHKKKIVRIALKKLLVFFFFLHYFIIGVQSVL